MRFFDALLSSTPGKTDMHVLIMESTNDICSLFDSYIPNHEAFTYEITWKMFSTQLRSSSKKNQIKRSSDVGVMHFANQVIFSSREFGPYGLSSPRIDFYHHGPERPEWTWTVVERSPWPDQSTSNSATLTHLLFSSQFSHFLDVWFPQIIMSFFDHIYG